MINGGVKSIRNRGLIQELVFSLAMGMLFGSPSFIAGMGSQGVRSEPENAALVVKFQEEAERSNAKSQYALASHYEDGKGVEENQDEALKWYHKAADQNLIEALSTLGLKYDTGRNVRRDDVEAVTWYRKAAEQGDAWSQTSLGYKYLNGTGLSRDLQQGVKWLTVAAEQGEPQAQYYLGICYQDAVGVPRNRIQAYKWLNLSASYQSSRDLRALGRAKAQRDDLEKSMTITQITEGQQLSSAFEPYSRSRKTESKTRVSPALKAMGTGFFVTQSGYLLTSAPVVKSAKRISVRTNHGVSPARVVKSDPSTGLALLKVDGKFESLPFGNSDFVEPGSSVCTVCFPNSPVKGLGHKMKLGGIRATANPPSPDGSSYFEVNVELLPGNSGGALVNQLGNVVGVLMSHTEVPRKIVSGSEKDIQYAVTVNPVLLFLQNLPEVVNGLQLPATTLREWPDIAKQVEEASVLVLVWE